MQVLQNLGWEWRDNGVIVTVVVDGRRMQVFVPIRRVWVTFENELSAVGCPGSSAVGCVGPYSAAVGAYGPGVLRVGGVGGFFDFVKKAVKKVGRTVSRAIPKAVKRAASKVASVAKKYGGAALKGAAAIGRSPVFRGAVLAASFAVPALAPVAGAIEAANRYADYYKKGLQAAKLVKQGVKNPQILATMAAGLAAKKDVAQILREAQAGAPKAQQFMGAIRTQLVRAEARAPGGAQALSYAKRAIPGVRAQRAQRFQAMMAARRAAAARAARAMAARRYA